MKKQSLVLFALAATALVSCGGTNGGSSSAASSYSQLNGVDFFQLEETDIGTSIDVTAGKLGAYSATNPLKISMVTDSGTLNDHSFNESAWNGINAFATKNGGILNATANVCDTGIVQTKYYQPAADAYTTTGRVAAIKSAVTWGAKIVILPGYLFQSAIKVCLDDTFYKDTYFLALDCTKFDSDNNYAPYDYTAKVTSVIYREEQAGYEAGYAAVKEGYRKLGFCGGMAVPAVVRYGSGYCQGADKAAQELSLADGSIGIQYYYAGAFAATDTATTYCTAWYKAGTEVIFGCGGAVYNSVIAGSQANNNAPWIGVDVNQHADTSLGASQASCITSAMKNLKNSTVVMLTSWVNSDGAWNSTYASKVITVGAKSDNCVLPTPDTTGDSGCWGFKNFTVADYTTLLGKLKAGTFAVNSNSDNAALSAHNFGCSAKVKVNYIE
jgi:basic membrane protein A